MRVLMIIDRMIVGGAEKVFEDLVVLLKNKIDLTILLISPSQRDQVNRIDKEIKVILLNRIQKFSIFKALECYRILKDYDVLHVHMRHTYRYISLVNKLFRLNKHIILHDHYGSINIDKSLPFMFSKYFKPSYYIGVSEELTNWAIGNWKIPYNRCITLINLPSQNNIKTNNDFFENGGLVMVGNIKTIKNQSFALELVKELREQIDIIGKVQDLDYYNKICNIYPEGVNFRLKIDNISHLLGRYKIGLFCSISESGPLVLLEYFVQGLPFIAYRTGGISDVLFKYVPQYFMDTFDMNCWVEKYQQLNENYSRIPVELINDVLRIEFDSEKYGEELISIYKLSEECVC